MATILGSTNNSLWTYKLEAYETSYNIQNNTSVVRVDVYLGRASSRSYLGGNWSSNVTVDGQTQYANGNISYPTYINGGEWLYLYTKDFTVSHNNDGTKWAGVSSSFSSSDFTPSSASASGGITLTTIPRATSCPYLNGAIGSSYNLGLNAASSNFTHSYKIHAWDKDYWLQPDGTLSSVSGRALLTSHNPLITIPKSFYANFDGYSTGFTSTLYTYSGNTQIGTSTNILDIYCNQSLCTPTVTATASVIDELSNTLTGNTVDVIQNVSSVLITPTIKISDTEDTKATITTKYVDSTIFTTDTVIVTKPLKSLFALNVVNSRTFSKAIWTQTGGNFIEYLPLTLSANIKRNEPTDGKIKIIYSGNYWSGNFGAVLNDLVITYQYKELNEENWSQEFSLTNFTLDEENQTFNGEELLYDFDEEGNKVYNCFDYKKVYNFKLHYYDKVINLYSESFSVSQGIPVFWWNANTLTVEGNLTVKGKSNINKYVGEEILIGEWFGKPLYRQVKILTQAYTDTTFINNGISDIDTIVRHNVWVIEELSESLLPKIVKIYPAYDIAIDYIKPDGFQISAGSHWTTSNSLPLRLVIEYTKTTDY